MNSEEQTLIDGLFSRLQQAEAGSAPRDAQAQALINEHLARQPAAAYYMTQAILVQEAALKQLDQQNKQLQAELAQARAAQAPAPASGSGSFLSGLFGGGDRAPAAPAAAPASSGGWRDGPAAVPPAPAAPQPATVAPAAGSSFLGGALKTAAGVAGGVMLAQGISSLFSQHQQPQIVEEIIEQPVPASDSGWGSSNQPFANNGGGIEDVGLDDDDSFFSDDDSYV